MQRTEATKYTVEELSREIMHIRVRPAGRGWGISPPLTRVISTTASPFFFICRLF